MPSPEYGATIWYHCPELDCPAAFAFKYSLVRHCKSIHGPPAWDRTPQNRTARNFIARKRLARNRTAQNRPALKVITGSSRIGSIVINSGSDADINSPPTILPGSSAADPVIIDSDSDANTNSPSAGPMYPSNSQPQRASPVPQNTPPITANPSKPPKPKPKFQPILKCPNRTAIHQHCATVRTCRFCRTLKGHPSHDSLRENHPHSPACERCERRCTVDGCGAWFSRGVELIKHTVKVHAE